MGRVSCTRGREGPWYPPLVVDRANASSKIAEMRHRQWGVVSTTTTAAAAAAATIAKKRNEISDDKNDENGMEIIKNYL